MLTQQRKVPVCVTVNEQMCLRSAVIPRARVRPLMRLQTGALREAFPALAALVRLLSAVHHGVPDQIAVFGEAAAALRAGEGLLARVTAQMLLQLTEPTEALLAVRAAEALLHVCTRAPVSPEPEHRTRVHLGTRHSIICTDLFRLVTLRVCLHGTHTHASGRFCVLCRWKRPFCVCFRHRRPQLSKPQVNSRLLIVLLRFNLESPSAQTLRGRLRTCAVCVWDL